MAEILIEFTLLGIAVLLIPVGLALTVLGLWRYQRRRLAVGVGCLLVSGVLLWGINHAKFWIVDKCLDAGGRYNDHVEECEFE